MKDETHPINRGSFHKKNKYMSDEGDFKNPLEEHHLPVLALLVKGKSVKKISEELDRPFDTVRSQVKRMHVLAGTIKTAELTYLAGKHKWV